MVRLEDVNKKESKQGIRGRTVWGDQVRVSPAKSLSEQMSHQANHIGPMGRRDQNPELL